MTDMFQLSAKKQLENSSPLAERMRPRTLDEFVGQKEILGEGRLLRRMITADKISSVIFFGPPGSGKTTLAMIIAGTTKSEFIRLNAVSSGVAEIKEIIRKAEDNLGMYGRRTIVFIDEIHRFNKSQQDALLPSVESGMIILIGATTENPYFEINPALISRSTVFELKKLSEDDIKEVIKHAIKDKERGLGNYPIKITKDAINHWANVANGDSRTALNALELAYLTAKRDDEGNIIIDLKTAEECIQKRAVNYDKKGDSHYDTISAFIKSMRGSSPDAALYYLAKMLYGGEDPKFIARRMVIFASEDISNADPNALDVAVNVFRAVEIIGMPECAINLAQGVTYLACARKSNASYMALAAAQSDIENKPTAEIPMHLRNAVYKAQKEEGVGKGYLYPHDFDGHWVKQEYMPIGMEGTQYYHPGDFGAEKSFKEYLEEIKKMYND